MSCFFAPSYNVWICVYWFWSLLSSFAGSLYFKCSTFLLGKDSHKDVKDSTNWLFKAYYGNRMFMAYCCVSCEVIVICHPVCLITFGKKKKKLLCSKTLPCFCFYPLYFTGSLLNLVFSFGESNGQIDGCKFSIPYVFQLLVDRLRFLEVSPWSA